MSEDSANEDSSSEDMELLESTIQSSTTSVTDTLSTTTPSSSYIPRFGIKPIALKYFIAAASFGLAMDQNLIAPNMTAIADEFNMDHKERDKKIGI